MKIAIVIEGGVVSAVYSTDAGVDISVIDHDDGDCDEELEERNEEAIEVLERGVAAKEWSLVY